MPGALRSVSRRVWVFVALACVVLAVAGLTYGPRLVSSHCPAQWTTVWEEDFNGPAHAGLSTASWNYETGRDNGNSSVEVMSRSTANVYLDGRGDLDITALDQGGRWTSGRIQSTRTFGAAPGCELRVMAAIRLPAAADALGYWPAFWMLGPGQWPENGEIDVLEDVNGLSDHSGAFHCGNLTAPNPDGTFGPCHEHTGISSGAQACWGCMAGFRTYSVVVDRRDSSDERITWYLDGTEFFQVAESQVGSQVWSRAVDHGFSIILDLAVGGTYPSDRCGCTTPAAQTTPGGTMSVRYVSVSAG